jgi:hypothetical protein
VVVETGSYQGFGWSSTLDVEFDVAGVHTGDSHIDAVCLARIREFVLNPDARRAGAALGRNVCRTRSDHQDATKKRHPNQTLRNVSRVSSLGANTRKGGPQNPLPLLV